MAQCNCPKCGTDISDSYEPDDWSVGVVGGWYCNDCDLAVSDFDGPDEEDYSPIPEPSPQTVSNHGERNG